MHCREAVNKAIVLFYISTEHCNQLSLRQCLKCICGCSMGCVPLHLHVLYNIDVEEAGLTAHIITCTCVLTCC